jgi:diamine N-acetyltransferase
MVEVRRASIKDLYQLQEIGRLTFTEAFAALNSEENFNQYLKKAFSLEKLTTELLDSNSEFYFAVFQSVVMGYLKLNFGPSQTDIQDNKSVEIERIYVLKAHQGKKVGQFLLDFALKLSKLANAEYVWLGVWEENPKAIKFYQKNGFAEFDRHTFKLGNEEQTDLMMKLSLQ